MHEVTMVFLRFPSIGNMWPPAILAAAIVLTISLPVEALRVLGGGSETCSPRIDPVTGISRVTCIADQAMATSRLKKPDLFTPTKTPPIIIGPTKYDSSHGITPTDRAKETKTLPQRLCNSQRTPYSGMDRNEEGHASRIVQCLPAGSIVGQESATFLPRRVQLARWRQLRDPFPYTQKHNRPLQLR